MLPVRGRLSRPEYYMTEFRIRIAVLDYGMGNLHSVSKALQTVAPKAEVIVTSDAREVDESDKVVFPGVGGMRDCMAQIRTQHFDTLVRKSVREKPVLAICVGMQALFSHSEENEGVDCLDIIPGRVRFFGHGLQDEDGARLKVPHMGWNRVHQTLDHPVWHGVEQDSRFYFVHSYHVADVDPAVVAGTCHYGVEFAAAVAAPNLFAAQFHPEKSHTAGLTLLKNFVEWNGQ